MSVFVDGLRQYPPVYAERQAARVGSRNDHRWCHMVADGGREELLSFALRIGLHSSWLQGDARKGYHFDLTPGRRATAVRAGAIETDHRGLIQAMRKSRGQP